MSLQQHIDPDYLRQNEIGRIIRRGLVWGFGGFIALMLLFGSWFAIDEGDRGIRLRLGKFQGIETPGLGFKIPIIDDIVTISVRQHVIKMKDVHSYSRDQQDAVLAISINYQAIESNLKELYTNYQTLTTFEQRIIIPQVLEELKVVFGRFNAVSAIQDRGRLNAEFREAMIAAVKGSPVSITSVQIENVDFSTAYEQSVEQRMLAEVEVQKIRQNAEREKITAEIVVIQAKAQADKVEALARAEAEKIKLIGNAEAEAIRVRGQALKDSPRLVELVQAEKWDGKLPTTVLPSTAVPLIGTKIER